MPTIEIFLAIFIFILFVLVSVEDIKTAFLLLLMLIPLQHKELFSLVIWDVIPIRIAFFGIFLSSFYRFYLWFRRYKKVDTIKNFVKDPLMILLFLLFILRLFSVLYSPEKIDSLKFLAFFGVVVFFYVITKYIYLKGGVEFVKRSVSLYVMLSFFMSVVSLIQFFAFKLYKIKFGAIWDIPGHNPRIGSTFWDVNHFGAFVASAIPISLVLAFTKKGYLRLFYIFNSLFLCFVLYLTESRSAWLGFAVAMFIAFLLLSFKGYKKYALILFTSVGILLVILLSYFELQYGSVVKKYKQFMHTRLDSFDTHFILVRGAYEAYSANPIFGEGYGTFNDAFRKTSFAEEYFFREKSLVDSRVPSHSIWGEVIAETGFLGLSVYLLIFFTVILLLFRSFMRNSISNSLLSLGFLSSILVLLVSGIFYTYNMEFFWYLVFAGYVLALDENRDLNFSRFLNYLYSIKKLPILFITLFSSFLIFWDLGKNKLIDWDEAIYAEIAKNVVKTHDLFTFYWTLGTPWFEKPPLYIWSTALFMWIFGANEITARIVSSIFGLLGVIVVYFFAKSVFKSRFSGIVASLCLVTTAHYWYYSRIGMMDVTVTFFVLASVFAYYRFTENFKIRYALISGIMVGLAVLTKAIVGLLPLGIVFIYSFFLLTIFRKQLNLKKYLLGVFVLLVFSVIVFVPWHIAMYLINGSEFWNSYFLTHIFGRGLTDAQGKTQNFFWYIDVMKISLRGWFVVLFPFFTVIDKLMLLVDKYNIVSENSVILTFYDRARYLLLLPVPLFLFFRKKSLFKKEYTFAFVYFLVIFLFFSISKTKLIWYIIPIYPAYALIISGVSRELVNWAVKRLKSVSKFNSLNYITAVSLCSILLCLSMPLYIIFVQDKVFYGDYNKDIAKVAQYYSENMYLKEPSFNNLYYLRMDMPALRFYTEGKLTAVEIGDLEHLVKAAPFDKNLVYISRKGEVDHFVNLYGDDKVARRYESGAIYLMEIRSEEGVYLNKIEKIKLSISSKLTSLMGVTDSKEINSVLNDINSTDMVDLYNYYSILNKNMPLKYSPAIRMKYIEALPNQFLQVPYK